MQSILQYRRFRGLVQQQHEGAKEKLQPTDENGSNGSNGTLTNDSPPRSPEEKDLEKGDDDTLREPSAAAAGGPGQLQHPTEEVEASTSQGEYEDTEMTNYLSRASTQRSRGHQLGRAMTGIEVRKRNTNEGGEGNVFIVGYHDDNDPMNPHTWSNTKRIYITFMVAAIGFVVGVASSIDSEAIPQASAEFHVSEVVESLATGLYLIGFGVGALFAGPFSETVGRNPVYIVTLTLYMIFIMASGLAPNIGAQLAFRFLAGFFGSTPLTCAGGSLSDIWSPTERTYTFPVFANAAFTGPVIGPVIGGYIAQHLDWRWCEWITLIMSGLVFFLVVFTLPETYPPVLLKWKAKHMRSITGDERYRAEAEVKMEPFTTRLGRALYRPFLLASTEPIIMIITLYLSIIYIVLFTFLDGYTYIFEEIHGTSQGVTGLCFLGIIIGLFGASALVPYIGHKSKKELKRLRDEGKEEKLKPEFRLIFAMFGAPAIPISLFWMGWTSDSNISIWSPLAASVLFGYGILCIFISSYQYIIDSYEMFAASALASLTLIRYVAAGGMTVVGIPFYENMGVHYTLTILACISCVVTPVPYVFYKYGPAIRKRSKYAPT
ncbi:hypothetical protein MBLNU457_g0114t1 [Dothideomycetes sp. NU457]